MSFPLGISDSQKKQPPLPPSVVSQSDSGSGRDFDNGASYLTFQDTTFTGKLPIIDYVVTAVSTDGLDTVDQTVNSMAPFVLTGLKSGKSYKFKVRARNLVFNSAYSSEFGPGIITTVPNRVTSAGATNLANGGSASISWTAPANGGKAITSYLITPNIGTPVETNSASTTHTIPGLTIGVAYNFTIAARNENGLGQASTTSNTVTITAPAPTPTPTPTVGGTTVGGTTVGGTSVTCGACQVVSGNVQEDVCIDGYTYTIYYQARAQICSDGSQIACTKGAEITRSGGTYTGCGLVNPCSPLLGTTCGTYSAGCGYVGTIDCGGLCVGMVCQGCCRCDPAFCTVTPTTPTVTASSCAGPCFGTWAIVNGVCQCQTATVNPSVGVVTVTTTPITPADPCAGKTGRALCTCQGGIYRLGICI